jgi:hypothetical protein
MNSFFGWLTFAHRVSKYTNPSSLPAFCNIPLSWHTQKPGFQKNRTQEIITKKRNKLILLQMCFLFFFCKTSNSLFFELGSRVQKNSCCWLFGFTLIVQNSQINKIKKKSKYSPHICYIPLINKC